MQVVGGLAAAPRQEVTVSPGAPFEMRLGWECSREPRQLGDVTFSSPCEFTSSRGGDLDCPLLPCQQGPRTAQMVLPCYGNALTVWPSLAQSYIQIWTWLLKKNKYFFSAKNSDNKVLPEGPMSEISCSARNKTEPSSFPAAWYSTPSIGFPGPRLEKEMEVYQQSLKDNFWGI